MSTKYERNRPAELKGLSVREARKTRKHWENEWCQQVIEIGLDPEFRADAIKGSQPMIELLRRPMGVASSMEIALALNPDATNPWQTGGKMSAHFAYLGGGYTTKLTPDRGMGKTRFYSKQAVCIIGMRSGGDTSGRFRAWMAEVVARASTHRDFRDLMDIAPL